MAHMIRGCLIFALALFFIIGCAEPMAVHATYVPVDWSCDDDRPERFERDGPTDRFEALSPTIGEESYEGLLEPDDDFFAPLSLDTLYGSGNEKIVAAPRVFAQSSPGLSFVVYHEGEGEASEASQAQRQGQHQAQRQAQAGPPTGVVNINEATAAQLTMLPGIGPSLAERIVEYRQTRRFAQPQHLRRVKGIGQAKYNQIKDHVVVDGETTMR